MSKSPEATYRIGNCSASVFVNEIDGDGGKRKVRSVNVQKSYKDGDERKYTSSFGLGELPHHLPVRSKGTHPCRRRGVSPVATSGVSRQRACPSSGLEGDAASPTLPSNTPQRSHHLEGREAAVDVAGSVQCYRLRRPRGPQVPREVAPPRGAAWLTEGLKCESHGGSPALSSAPSPEGNGKRRCRRRVWRRRFRRAAPPAGVIME